MIVRSILAIVLVGTVAACSKEAPPTPQTTAIAAQAATPTATLSAARSPLQLGEPISPQALSLRLSDLAAHPSDFRGKTIATGGTVTAVCQSMGCWMEIKDDKGAAHIRMHGHSFFVPKTASGRSARVQGTLVPADDKTECDDEGGDAGATLAKLDFDATGVELE